MGGLKTLCLSLVLAGLASTAKADDGLLRHVSECVGRYSAQMEHHWMFQDKSSDQIERQRAHLIDILDTLTTPQNATNVLAGRIDAKMAHAALLTRAAFSDDPRLSVWAADRAERNLRMCGDITLMAPDTTLTSVLSAPDTPETLNQRAVQVRR